MATPSTGPETAVQIRRTFTAPREKVFQAWLDPKMMPRWFGRGIKEQPHTRVVELDARTGGHYKVEVSCPPDIRPDEQNHERCQSAPDLRIYKMQGQYREVRPPERLVFTWWWEGADFRDSLVTVEFRALGQSNFTEVLLTHELLPEKEREDHRQGWEGCFNMLEETLKINYERLDTLLGELQS